MSELTTGGVLFLKISQYSQEITCQSLIFNKVAVLRKIFRNAWIGEKPLNLEHAFTEDFLT